MSDTTDIEVADEAPVDEARSALVDTLTSELGDELVETYVLPGRDLWIRIEPSAWVHTHEYAKSIGFTFIDFISAIDWLPSPFGREMDSEVDNLVHGVDEKEPVAQTTGYAGGSSRFQMISRVFNISTNLGIHIKADLDDDAPSIDTLIEVFAGANWHEREVWEMFGIDIVGHPDLRPLYLPTGFEGNPMRKDFPLLARRIKPWPGIVDVEPMPGDDDDAGDGDDA